MAKRFAVIAVVAILIGVVAQSASADPVHAKFGTPVLTLVCDSDVYHVVSNGNGIPTPAHVIDSTAVFVPVTLDLTISFTPTGGTPEIETETLAKSGPSNGKILSCSLPLALNTFTFPEGTFSVSGAVTAFIA
jgi:hypothetical protein